MALLFCALPALAAAQTGPVDRFHIAVGGRWSGPSPLGSSAATYTTPGGDTVTLFSTETELSAAPSVEGRVGVRLTQHLRAEGLVAIGFSRLTTRVTGDLEGADDLDVSESVHQLTLGGALVAEIGAWQFGRATPFITGGGGYLRQLHEGRPVVEEGETYHAGGGLNILLRAGTGFTGRQNATGIRFDARVDFRRGGVSFDDEMDRSFSAGALLFFRF